MTQGQIAPCFGVGQAAYCAWEKGIREPDLSTLCNVANYFGVSTDSLLGNVTPLTLKTKCDKTLRTRISTLRKTALSVSDGAEILLQAIDELEGTL